MTIIEALLLGLVQGITEFIPVSSSGHLAIIENLLNISREAGLPFAKVCIALLLLMSDYSRLFPLEIQLLSFHNAHSLPTIQYQTPSASP